MARKPVPNPACEELVRDICAGRQPIPHPLTEELHRYLFAAVLQTLTTAKICLGELRQNPIILRDTVLSNKVENVEAEVRSFIETLVDEPTKGRARKGA